MQPYVGNSVVDYLKSVGQPTDYASRAQLAASKGIQNYSGTAAQNTQLLNTLRGSAPAAAPTATTAQPAQQPFTPTPTPQQQPAATSAPANSSGAPSEQALISAMTQKGHTVETARAAIAGRGVADLSREYLGTQTPGSGGGAAAGFVNQPTINLPELYDTITKNSGISEKETELGEKTRQFNEQMSKINDNPYLSEASRVGRGQKLQTDFNNSIAGLQNEIAMKKADIETQLNLQTKQFDINSEQSKQAFDQFNSLLSSGALDNASGEDIANITRATGISSTLIQSAIDVSKKSKEEKPNVTTYDDGTNEYFVAVDPQGNIVNKQLIGPSSSALSGGGGGTYQERTTSKYMQLAQEDAKRGMTLTDLINYYKNSLDLADILNVYKQADYYGTPQETSAEIQNIYQYGTKSGKKDTPTYTGGSGGGNSGSSYGNILGF